MSDDTRKELDDYVRHSLQAMDNNTDWARFEDLVGTLVGRVATMCQENMDAQPSSRPVNPSQGWRWRQQQQRQRQLEARGDRRPETSGGSGTAAERERQRQGERHPSGHHGSRHRRRNAARPRFDGPEVQRIQRSFRRNRKRCVRGILEGENSGQCTIPAGDVEAFFRNESSRAEVDVDNQPEWLSDCLRAPLLNAEGEERPISPGEVKAQMKRLPSSSAPGPDRLPYKVWKAIDPEGVILARIFEVCRQRKKVPSAWKTSTTILIHKSGDKEEPRNWRPISLQNAIYKLYVAIWGRRLAGWASEAGAVSPAQKGFVPGEGCLEHSFLVRSMMEDARRRHRPLHLVWFDLRNAFGSIPHNLLWHSMRSLGAPEEVVSILMDIYQGSTYTVQTEEGATAAIPQERGVKQGCPISPLIFNLAIEGLIRGIQSSAARGYSFGEALEVKCLAYADDLAIAASREEDVRMMLTRLEEFSRWANVDFNVAKCASLSTTYQAGKRVVLQQCFTLKGQAIPVMTWEDRYKHLGVLLGPNPDSCLEKLADNFREDTKKLFQSGLADWMKLEAFRDFVMPKLDYAMRSTLAHKNWALKLDKYVRQTVKQALGLPRRTCDAVFYVPAAKGGLGLRSIADELGNLLITQATKMLTSPDPLVRGIATHSLDCTILKRYGNTEGPEDRWRFLSGQLRREDEGRRGDISSVWSRMRSFTTTIEVRLHGGTAESPAPTSVTIGEKDLSRSQLGIALLRGLRSARGEYWLGRWSGLAEQGGLAGSFSRAPESNYWIRQCRYLRYREYRWALKARLNLLPVASHKRKYGGTAADTRCRGCRGAVETQEHCLSVCQGNMPAMKARHDQLQKRLVNAIPPELGTKFIDQAVPGCPGQRPDVVIIYQEKKKPYLIDVTCPNEHEQNLVAARRRKVEKYQNIKDRLTEQGFDTTLDAFVVGTLGIWDPEIDHLLSVIGIGQKYGILFKKLCCRDAISGSYEVWACRCRRHFQQSFPR